MIFGALINNYAADRSGTIPTGLTMLSKPLTFGASDTIVSGTTTTYTFTNLQKFQQNFTFTVALTAVTGTHNMAITAYGKVTSNGSWVQIGTPITWVTASNNGSITSTSPVNYNYLKVTFVESGSECKALVSSFEIKTSNAYDIPASSGTLTIGRATTGAVTIQVKDDDANAAATYRAGGTGALTLGASTGTTAITSSDWAISATGAMTGMGAITADGLITGTAGATLSGAAINLNASSNYATNIGTGSTTQAVTIGNAANSIALVAPTTATGAVTANGGLAFASGSTVFWAKGGAPLAVATGTDVACSAGDRYWTEIEIPHNATITGLTYLVGSVGGTDSVMVHLYNSAGTQVATSKKAGATHGDIVGTAAELQSVAFTAPYAAVAGKYFAAVQFNGTTAKFRAYLMPGSKFVANTAAGTYDTAVASITPTTSFVVNKGPIIATY